MWLWRMKIHTKFSSMQNLKTKKKKYYFISCGESKSVALLCIKGSKGATNSVTYIFTVASSYVTIHFLAFTYVNIFFLYIYVTAKTIDKFQYPLILSFSLCMSQILHSILNWNVPWSIQLCHCSGWVKCRLKHSLTEI